jgi:transcriptional regulator with XRE-family HTH domain
VPSFGDQLRRLMKTKGIPLKAVAARAGLSYGFVWRLMRGYHDPTLSVVLRLATALDVRPSQLIDGIDGAVRRNGHGPGFPKSDVRATLVSPGRSAP